MPLLQANAAKPVARLSLLESLSIILRQRCVVLLYVAGSVRFIGGFALGSYLAKYFQAAFPDDNSLYSVLNGLIIGFGGTLSSMGGGFLADRVAVKHGQQVPPL